MPLSRPVWMMALPVFALELILLPLILLQWRILALAMPILALQFFSHALFIPGYLVIKATRPLGRSEGAWLLLPVAALILVAAFATTYWSMVLAYGSPMDGETGAVLVFEGLVALGVLIVGIAFAVVRLATHHADKRK